MNIAEMYAPEQVIQRKISASHCDTLKAVFAIIGCEGECNTFNVWNVKGTPEEVLERLRKFHEVQTEGGSFSWDIPF